MRIHRIIFWSIFILVSLATIGFETGNMEINSFIKLSLFVSITGAGILAYNLLIPALLEEKRFVLLVLFIPVVMLASLLLETLIEHFLLGPHPFGQWQKLKENLVFIVPWLLIACTMIIVEHRVQKKLETANAELLYLKHQVNPHFLLNMHNNINFLIHRDPALASATLLKLSGIMQYMIYECNADLVPVVKEFENLEQYIELEKLRKNDNLDLEYKFDYPEENIKVAPLLLISFVENAFKHVSYYKDKNFIRIEAKVVNHSLNLKVSNTIGETDNDKGRGIGIANVKSRLRLLYKNRHRLFINKEQGVYTVDLMINL